MRNIFKAAGAVILVSGVTAGLLVIPAAVAAPTAADCDALQAKATNTKAQTAWLDCRLDRIDARLDTSAPVTSPSSSSAISTPPTTTTPPPSTTTAAPPTTSAPGTGTLNLPVKAYAGGPDFWAKYPAAKAAGWTDPNFFPIVLWYGSCTNDGSQYAFDKARGINTYAQCNPDTEYAPLKAAGMDTLFTAKNQPADATTQPGVLLDDEVDGRYSDTDGKAHLTQLDAQYGTGGKFSYVNYTSGIVTYDRSTANASAYLNGSFNDVIGLDQYFYSNPQCSWTDANQAFRYITPEGETPINRANCRTASSYGKAQHMLQQIDASNGATDKAIWAFVEVISPGAGTQNGGSYVQPSGAQIKAAAWQSIIHGAAGIDWFSQSPDGGSANGCQSGDALRDVRLGQGCAYFKTNVEAMGQVNNQILSLAPVLNTPTYVWNAGPVDSLLKAKDGKAYLFAMTKDGGSGSRTMTLPDSVKGTTVEVVGENRTLTVSGGSFTDTFAAETTTHIYKVSI